MSFFTPQPSKRSAEKIRPRSESAKVSLFHIRHKVPAGDSPYVRAKHVQLIDKDPSKAVSLFWAAINSGDRVDSALKDMAVVMKQLNRSDEAIEAIKSFRHLCPHESQDSLDNILLELYKKAERLEEEIELLQSKLKQIEEGYAFGGRNIKWARSQGKKVQVSVEKEYSRLLGNLAWAKMQQGDLKSAEEHYRKALSFEPDKNKQCNLAICLMKMNKVSEAKLLLQTIGVCSDLAQVDESYAKSFERATQMLADLTIHSELPLTIKVKRGPYTPLGKAPESGWRRDSATVGAEPRYSDKEVPSVGVPFTQPRRSPSAALHSGDRNQAYSAGIARERCSRKLSFDENIGKSEEVQQVGKLNLSDEKGILSEEYPKSISEGKSKKSWADMVEEDEQESQTFRGDRDKYAIPFDEFNDENMDYNINITDGYHSQPFRPPSRHFSEIDHHLKPQKEEFGLSPSRGKQLNFENYSSVLRKENSADGKGMESLPRRRLPVFKEITLLPGSPRY